MREKLIELLTEAETKVAEAMSTPLALEEWLGVYADHLIENGVVVIPQHARLILDRKLEEVREKVACPQFGDDGYGAWGILRLDQRMTILSMVYTIAYLDEMLEEKFKAEAALKEG